MYKKYFQPHLSLIDELEKKGFKGYFVGGCVRDALMDKVSEDIDIATDALPSQVKEVFNECYDTGIKYGTVSVKHSETMYQITTFRNESNYSDNRRPDNITFSKSLEEDLSRRDFTINAMAYNPKEDIIDLFGGINDIKTSKIKAVGDPDERFKEDALRILRAVRFSCTLGFDIEEKTLSALKNNSHLLSNISVERIREEIKKILVSKHPQNIEILKSFDLFKEFEHVNVNSFPKRKDLTLRLAYVLKGTDYKEILSKYKASRETASNIEKIMSNLELPDTMSEYFIRKLMSVIGYENALIVMELNEISTKLIKLLHNRGDCISISDLDISARRLIENNIVSEGVEVGKLLDYLLDEILKHPYNNTYPYLVKLSKEFK